MQLTLENPDFDYLLRGANGSAALVNDRRLERSFIVAPDALVEDWDVASVGGLTVADLEPVLALQPEVVLLGSGSHQVFPPAEVLAACLTRGIGMETMANDAVARTYQVLAGEGRRVVAAFVLSAA
ncbi:hypothetical protein E4582_01325 [Luteimonas yindakuii]|uniref:Xcc1710-like domain-containing protein n=1 Tax=Luteimonas yindakuii TaxID=2565782 RepID=A0A4Z1RA08_9GAMM|nr:Mth938-like domain-containing protein [Luteimonas yindakuii]TKS53548.1 hypothetical protein E4582_01325 [Luteimonas yindakuii]